MKLTAFLKELNISKWSAAWAFISDGWVGILKLVCEAFTKLLQKANPEKLLKYSELAAKIAVYIRGGIETFCPDGASKDAGMKTADAVATVAEHLKDGKYEEYEANADIENVKDCIELWQKAIESEEQK